MTQCDSCVVNSVSALDHSVHTCRLWVAGAARALAAAWAVADLFRVAHGDLRACLAGLSCLRFADHSDTIDEGKGPAIRSVTRLLNF